MAVRRGASFGSASGVASSHGSSSAGAQEQPWRSYVPSLLVGQLCFWLVLGALYLRFSGDHDTPEALLLQAERDKADASLVKLNRLPAGIPGSDKRGWITSPLHAAAENGLEGARRCVDVHVGIVGPGAIRGNHRHHRKNESFLAWGAHGKWRIEHPGLPDGYAEVMLKAADVSVFTAPIGRAHAVVNLDRRHALNLMVCADTEWDAQHPDTDYHIWADL